MEKKTALEKRGHLHLSKVLKEIADEELAYVGELPRLLRELAPDEAKFYAKGQEK